MSSAFLPVFGSYFVASIYSFFSAPSSFFLSAFFFCGLRLFVNSALVSSFEISTALLTLSAEYHTGAGVRRVVPVFVTATVRRKGTLSAMGCTGRQNGRTGDCEGRDEIPRLGVVRDHLNIERLQETVLHALTDAGEAEAVNERNSNKLPCGTHANFARPSFSRIRRGKGKAPAFFTISE